MNDAGNVLDVRGVCSIPCCFAVERDTELLLCDVGFWRDSEVIGDGGEDDDGADEDGS